MQPKCQKPTLPLLTDDLNRINKAGKAPPYLLYGSSQRSGGVATEAVEMPHKYNISCDCTKNSPNSQLKVVENNGEG